MFGDPLVGFYFTAVFELLPQNIVDTQFQSISGLKASIETEPYAEGGQNRYKHQLPLRTKYENLVLKRGLTSDFSGLTLWCNQALENFVFTPANVLVTLLNDKSIPVKSWYVMHAIPIGLEVSEFNAEENKMVIQSLTLSYQFYKEITIPL